MSCAKPLSAERCDPVNDSRRPRQRITPPGSHFCEQNCKPGSVFDSHLSRRAVASALQPPRERPGRPFGGEPRCSHTGVAPDRVYSDGQFPAVGCALTAPFHPYRHSAAVAAVYLCCTFPEVAFGGRYPLSLPCGARTFLINGLSACSRGCLFSSRRLLYRQTAGLSTRLPEPDGQGIQLLRRVKPVLRALHGLQDRKSVV